MNYHNIVKDDMRNGVGLRVTLFVSGCSHHCAGCHNPQTWDPSSGILFDEAAKSEIKSLVNKDYIDGITFSGGDPLYVSNRGTVGKIANYVKSIGKSVWCYTGYRLRIDDEGNFYLSNDFGDSFTLSWLDKIDVLVDSPFDIELLDPSYPWAGSTNQRVIDVQKSLKAKGIVLFDDSLDTGLDDVCDPGKVTCSCDRNS